eukprot:2504083-Pyramimonas_sp.AAC.1
MAGSLPHGHLEMLVHDARRHAAVVAGLHRRVGEGSAPRMSEYLGVGRLRPRRKAALGLRRENDRSK